MRRRLASQSRRAGTRGVAALALALTATDGRAGDPVDDAGEWRAAAPEMAPGDDHLPPWGDAAPPGWARSVHVLLGDEPVLAGPDGAARRRGSAAREAHLPLFGARMGPGCRGAWLQVGASAWICGAHAEVSGAAPVAAGAWPVAVGGDGLPFRYYFVNADGTSAYQRIEEVDVGEPAMQLDGGFAVALVEERALGRELYARTNRGLWVPMRDLHPANPLVFEGAELDAAATGSIEVAWVVSERAPRFTRAGNAFAPSARAESRFRRVAARETASALGTSYVRDDDGSWLRARDLRQPTLAPPPSEIDVGAGERWIDVELATQTLVAYEGARPVFATLVSTGKGAQGSGNATPKGTFRIWIKLFTGVMDNLEDEDAARYYRMEDVPYVQYFQKGVGLHAAYWHHSFGQVRSHGCVNLSPLDAARLFRFTTPRLPGGWTAVLPVAAERATVVRVR